MYSKLTRIDASILGDHYYLERSDNCFFLGEYTARKGHSFSDTNNLIYNLKKGVDKKSSPQWKYKLRAIQTIAHDLHKIFAGSVGDYTWVPIPPSKMKSDPLYDSRMTDILVAMRRQSSQYDCRELIVQNCSTEAAHDSNNRPTPLDIESRYFIDETLLDEPIKPIIIFDDMLTAGAHFKAAQSLLQKQFPGTPINGVFITRRAPEAVSFDEIDFDDF